MRLTATSARATSQSMRYTCAYLLRTSSVPEPCGLKDGIIKRGYLELGGTPGDPRAVSTVFFPRGVGDPFPFEYQAEPALHIQHTEGDWVGGVALR